MHYGLDTLLIRIGADTTSLVAILVMRSRYLHPGDAPQDERMAPTGFRFPAGAEPVRSTRRTSAVRVAPGRRGSRSHRGRRSFYRSGRRGTDRAAPGRRDADG